ncbi:MAG: hypothetical protein K2L14_06680 [Duncaniella sp.]|nr:hypothetical protein [Duncaniella sp.]
MKSISKFLALIGIGTAIGCTPKNGQQFDATYLSVEVPYGFFSEETTQKGSSVIKIVRLMTEGNKHEFAIMSEPFIEDPSLMLYNQTIGKQNPTFLNMTYPTAEVTPFDFNGRSGYEISMEGDIQGMKMNGKGYCFNAGGGTFVVYCLSRDKHDPDLDRKVIESIIPNKGHIANFDSRKKVEYAEDMVTNGGTVIENELYSRTGVEIDHDGKEIIYKYTIAGDLSKITDSDERNAITGQIIEILNNERHATLDWLKESYNLRPHITIPVNEGYAITYDYQTYDGTYLCRISYSPEEIKGE